MLHPVLATPSPCRAGVSRRSSGASELIALLPDEAHQDPLLGRGILKDFDGQEYFGHVVGIDAHPVTGERFYHVTYEDGDEEHLLAAEVVKLSRGRQLVAPPPSCRPSLSYSRAATPRPSFSLSRAGTPRPSIAQQSSSSSMRSPHEVPLTPQSRTIRSGFECAWLVPALCALWFLLWLLPDGLMSTDVQDDSRRSQMNLLDSVPSTPSWESSLSKVAADFEEVELSLPHHQVDRVSPEFAPPAFSIDVLADGSTYKSDVGEFRLGVAFEEGRAADTDPSFAKSDPWQGPAADVGAAFEKSDPWQRQSESHTAIDARSRSSGDLSWLQTEEQLSPDDLGRWALTARAEFMAKLEEFFSTYGDDAVTLMISVVMLACGIAILARNCFKGAFTCCPISAGFAVDSDPHVGSQQLAAGDTLVIPAQNDEAAVGVTNPAIPISSPMVNTPSRQRAAWPTAALVNRSPSMQPQDVLLQNSPLSHTGVRYGPATASRHLDPQTPIQSHRSAPYQRLDGQTSPIPPLTFAGTTPRQGESALPSPEPAVCTNDVAPLALSVQLGVYYVVMEAGEKRVAKAISLNAAKNEVVLQLCEANRKRFKLTQQTTQVFVRDLLHGPFVLSGGYAPKHIAEHFAEVRPSDGQVSQPAPKARLRNRYMEMPQQRFRFMSSLRKMTELGFEDSPELREVLTQCSGDVNAALHQFWSDE